MILVDPLEEGDTGFNSFGVFTGDTGVSAALKSDGEIEGLVSFFTKSGDGDVLSDFNTAAEFDAHLSENIDLRLQDILLKTERGDSVEHHSAGTGFFLKYGHIVSALSEIVSTGESGRTCTNHGHLVVGSPHLAFVVFTFRNIALSLIQLEACNEFFDLVNGDRGIDRAAGASVLTAPVADRSAHSGEGVVLLDEAESLRVASFTCHLDITLNGKVRRTRSLAGSSTGVVAVDLGVFPVVGVPLVRTPEMVVREHRLRIFDLTLFGAQFLAKFCRADGAHFHAFSAGHTFFLVDMGSVCGAGHVGRVV